MRRTLPLLTLMLAASFVAAADWPQWRGPHRDGLSADTGLLREWPKGGPPLAWEVKGLGKGFSSVAVAAGRIYTLGDRQNGQYLIALNEADGKELWATPVGKSWADGGPRSTPTVDGERVYALGAHGDLVCAETATGREVWRKNLAKDFAGHMMSSWGYSESPLVDGDRLVCTPGGADATLVALDKKTGDVVWKGPVPGGDGAGYASIMITEAGGVRQYIQLLGRGLVGLAAADGRFLWRYGRIANTTANIPTPLVHGDLVFCSTGYNTGSALLRLVSTGSGGVKAEEVYFLPPRVLQNHHGGLVPVGDYVYGGHGHNEGFPVCVELATGRVAWRQDRGPGTGSAAVVYADGCVYFRYQNGVMALIEATPQAYHLKGTFRIPHNEAPSWPHPVVANGKLYLREGDWLLCYDVTRHGG